MAKIPQSFIDQLLSRVDIVDVIDRRVPLTRKGKEFQARCPFHDEKTPSFTVSPAKQFYHCFGCGAHGTAIGFLMAYANLGFIEAVEELADAAGLKMPAAGARDIRYEKESASLLEIVDEANRWYQKQLRGESAKSAIAYLKGRGLDGRTAANFGVGFAPDGWDNLLRALGSDDNRRQQLLKAGLIARRDKGGQDSTAQSGGKSNGKSNGGYYDRFRARVMFPIEDYRGRVVGFGGRIIGDGEPKYLNSPETPLFHKGAELYGLHRARRAIGKAGHSIVVEGYMDVVSLAQFGIDNAVATLGTATTRAHIQRLFRTANDIVFCFDGDRAGHDAAWKAMQAALPEMHDGRQLGFLFLPEGEDPDSVVRTENADGFADRVSKAESLPTFLFRELKMQAKEKGLDDNARLAGMVEELLVEMPDGKLRDAMNADLVQFTGLAASRGKSGKRAGRARNVKMEKPLTERQLSPLAQVTGLLLQNPQLAREIDDVDGLKNLDIRGIEVLGELIDKIAAQPDITTARLVESMRETKTHAYLEKLAAHRNLGGDETLSAQFGEAIARLFAIDAEQRRSDIIEKLAQASGAEKKALEQEMKDLLAVRAKALRAHEN